MVSWVPWMTLRAGSQESWVFPSEVTQVTGFTSLDLGVSISGMGIKPCQLPSQGWWEIRNKSPIWEPTQPLEMFSPLRGQALRGREKGPGLEARQPPSLPLQNLSFPFVVKG